MLCSHHVFTPPHTRTQVCNVDTLNALHGFHFLHGRPPQVPSIGPLNERCSKLHLALAALWRQHNNRLLVRSSGTGAEATTAASSVYRIVEPYFKDGIKELPQLKGSAEVCEHNESE